MRRFLSALVLAFASFLGVLVAAEEPAGGATPFPANEVALSVPPGAQAGPDFDIERATQAYIETLAPEKREKSDAYFEGGYWLTLFAFLYGLATAWVFLGWRLSARLRDKAEAWSRRPFLQSYLYALLFVPAAALLALPLKLYADFYREHQYGMANQTLGEWLGDQAKGLLVALILMPLVLSVLYAVFRKAGRNWWIWGALTAMAFLVLGMLIAPVYIDPLFNDYKSLPGGELRERILSIAHATGVPAEDVVWFDASRQTKRISANVAGFGATMRVALNDNLLRRSPPEAIEAVMGHELGHYTLNHIYEGILEIGALLIVGFAFCAWAFDRALARFGGRWGVRGIADPAGLPLLEVLFAIYMFVLTPVTNSIIRANEAEADRYGIATSGQADGFAFVAMQLSEYRKISPGYWEEIIFYDHPSGYNRVRAAMEWKAEHGGRVAPPAAEPAGEPAGEPAREPAGEP
jgi:STE24 endopeptidase